jgi:aspartyl protease family protein
MRVKGELLPTVPQDDGDGRVTLRRNIDGHFAARVLVNGRPATFLVDTGASSVVLPWRVADDLGYDPNALSFIVTVGTANGNAVAAPIRIGRMEMGGIVLENVEAMVVEEGKLSHPLLGMSFLNRLHGFDVTGNTLTLRR